jgi:integrase
MPDLHTHTLAITAAYTGMRFGELARLTRAHVHLDRASVHVAAETGALREVSGDRWLGPPKTHRTWMDEDGIAEPLNSQRFSHQLPGIRGVHAQFTEPCTGRCFVPLPWEQNRSHGAKTTVPSRR